MEAAARGFAKARKDGSDGVKRKADKYDAVAADQGIDLTQWRAQNSSGYRGVTKQQTGRFVARIRDGTKQKSLGTYATAEEAARVFAKERMRVRNEGSVEDEQEMTLRPYVAKCFLK